MPPDENEATPPSLSWPLSDRLVSTDFRCLHCQSLQNTRGQCVICTLPKPGEATKSSVSGAIPRFHLPIRSRSQGSKIPNLVSEVNDVQETSHQRTALALDLERPPMRAIKVASNEEIPFLLAAQLRGGADERQTGFFGRLKRDRKVHQKLNDRDQSSVVTYKGKKIGFPQPVSALNVLPPASRFVKQPETRPREFVPKPPLSNNYDGNDSYIPTPLWHGHYAPARSKSPPLPPPPALLATASRPATTNPFACIYGNPNAVRVGPIASPVDHATAGSLVDRPSALDGSQTGYGPLPRLPSRSSLRTSYEAPKHTINPKPSSMKITTQKVRADRKWDALPPLPPGEEAAEPPPKDNMTEELKGADNEPFDTEEVLKSLRPERLSLYHIGTPGRSVDKPMTNNLESAATTTHPQAIVSNTRRPGDHESLKITDSYSIHTREWELQSCATDDLGLDNQLQQQEQLAQRTRQRRSQQEQWRQENIRDNNEPLNGLPEEDAPTPEGVFYTELIEILKEYYERQRVIRRAYEAGVMSEDHWRRDKWRYQTALDKTVRAAADMSGYNILTAENDIKENIKQPTGYAIYSSLYKIRDPQTWQRIFEPASAYSHSVPVTMPPQQQPMMPENSLIWLARKLGRALRFVLAVPDDPDVKTYSSRRPPPHDTLAYQSQVSALGPNIPSRVHISNNTVATAPLSTSLRQNPTPAYVPPSPSAQFESLPKISDDTTRVNNNTMFTGVTLASPLNGRHVRAPRSRGYEQSAFVTVLTPSTVSVRSEKTMAGYGAGMLGKRHREKDDESKVTTWPEVDW